MLNEVEISERSLKINLSSYFYTLNGIVFITILVSFIRSEIGTSSVDIC